MTTDFYIEFQLPEKRTSIPLFVHFALTSLLMPAKQEYEKLNDASHRVYGANLLIKVQLF